VGEELGFVGSMIMGIGLLGKRKRVCFFIILAFFGVGPGAGRLGPGVVSEWEGDWGIFGGFSVHGPGWGYVIN
jgi:hypothetical protein